MRPILLSVVLTLALAGCQQADSEMTTGDTEGTVAPSTVPAADTASPAPTAAPTGAVATAIPAALHGRWGMVPADCTSTRGDAKGLLTIAPTSLTFYESVGRLGTVRSSSDMAIRADYAFTGEGMNWTRDVELSVSGDTMTRTDRGGDEPGGPFTYTRCS